MPNIKHQILQLKYAEYKILSTLTEIVSKADINTKKLIFLQSVFFFKASLAIILEYEVFFYFTTSSAVILEYKGFFLFCGLISSHPLM